MRDLIKKAPIPTAGVALGLAALGNLLQPVSDIAHTVCGVLALLFIALLVTKVFLFPQLIRDDLHNSISASVSGTAFMTFMQLSTYLAPFAYEAAFVIWVVAVAGHVALIIWFTFRFIRKFKLHEVFPTYFICYVGIIVASVTSPTFGMQVVGEVLFWFGFVCYIVLLGVVTYRYAKHAIPEAARPLFCIYAAPMSLSLVGYLAAASHPNVVFVAVLLVLAQLLFVVVLSRLPCLLRLKFYPSYAAMTFPFVITATALWKGVAFLRNGGIALPFAFDVLIVLESALATGMVAYVVGHYLRFFFRRIEQPKNPQVLKEEAREANFSENFEN